MTIFIFWALRKSASNTHTAERKGFFSTIISDILINGDINDLILIDSLLHHLIPSTLKMHPMAGELVKNVLKKCTSNDFGKMLQSFFNTLFLEEERAVSKVGPKWVEVMKAIYQINPKLIYPCFSAVEDRMDQETSKPTDRVKATQVRVSEINLYDLKILKKNLF